LSESSVASKGDTFHRSSVVAQNVAFELGDASMPAKARALAVVRSSASESETLATAADTARAPAS
jgi:hypothetical protein